MIRVVVKCVLDRLWQSPKNFLAKRGEVFIDDLFRYLSAALLRSARSTFSWIFFSFGYWFKYDDSAVVWFLYGYCHVIRNCYWTEQVRPNDNSLGTRERDGKMAVSNYGLFGHHNQFYRLSRTRYLAINFLFWPLFISLAQKSIPMVENARCIKLLASTAKASSLAVVQFNFSALCWHLINGSKLLLSPFLDEYYELCPCCHHLLFIFFSIKVFLRLLKCLENK